MSKAEVDEANKRIRTWRAGAGDPVLDQPTVRFTQVALTDLGYSTGPVDGHVGPRTRQALSDYQAKAGLAQDGALSAAVVDRLKADRQPGGSAVARSSH